MKNREDQKTILYARLLLPVLLLFVQQLCAQPVHRADAYRLFEDSSTQLKLGYLHYPILAKTPAAYRNETYARKKIATVVMVQETKDSKDTVSVTRFNKKGFIVRKDSFYLWEGVKQHLELSYEYTPEENKLKEKKQYRALQSDSAIVYRYETTFWFDKNNFQVKNESVNYYNYDTLTTYFENDSLGIIKTGKTYQGVAKREVTSRYRYRYDEMGRVTEAFVGRFAENKRALESKKRALYDNGSRENTDYDRHGFNYDDVAHRVNYYYDGRCTGTDLFTKNEHTLQDHCCPDKDEYGVMWKQQKIVFDKEGRIQTWSTAYLFKGDLCEKKDPGWRVQTYIYNKDGLLSAVNSTTEKLTVYYLKK